MKTDRYRKLDRWTDTGRKRWTDTGRQVERERYRNTDTNTLNLHT